MNPRPLRLLEHHGDRNRFTGIFAVVEIIPIVIANINVIGGIPVFCPVFRPRVHHHERIAAILELRVAPDYDGLAPDAKPVPDSKVEAETSLGDVVASISAALRPTAVIALPVRGAIVLPG